MSVWKLLITGLLLTVLLGACGLKGPLYLPGEQPPATEAGAEEEEEDGPAA
jgi:predicted small lipoprotein YifL